MDDLTSAHFDPGVDSQDKDENLTLVVLGPI
jgi:hypothetical protein